MPGNAIISFIKVSKIFAARGSPVTALEDVTFDVAEREFVCLLGPSGCGKTTLLNLVAGFDEPTTGQPLFRNGYVRAPHPERAVVFQDPALFPWLTVLDNVTFGPKAVGQKRSIYLPRARQYISLVRLNGFENYFPAQLSGGMRQRVGIARVLVMEPSVLLMDEPFGALDAQTRAQMQELVLNVWEQLHTTVLFVTHDIEEAILLSDTVYVMTARPGRIKRQIRVTLPRPRDLDMTTSGEFNLIKREILGLIREETRRDQLQEAVQEVQSTE